MRSARGDILATVVAAVVAVAATACGDDGERDGGMRTILEFPDVRPGDVIALRASDDDADVVEWVDRRAGTIRSVAVDGGDVATLAAIEVGTEGEQRGLLGHTVLDGVRYAAWTEVGTNHLLVGELSAPADGAPGDVERIVWDAGGTSGGAVGGHLARGADGRLVLGIGQLTDWAQAHGSGAMVALDPSGPADQVPEVVSDGYTNPFAFAVVEAATDPALDGALWVADNAVGDDVERIGRGDLVDRDVHVRSAVAPRAPSAVVVLADGDLAICGFLDAQLRRWTPTDGYGDTIGPCLTGATRLADGTIVTATADDLVALDP